MDRLDGRFASISAPTVEHPCIGKLMPDRTSTSLAVGAFADPNFPAPSVSIFEESKHTWTQLPDGMKHFQGAIIASS
jgi:hypothetical protein